VLLLKNCCKNSTAALENQWVLWYIRAFQRENPSHLLSSLIIGPIHQLSWKQHGHVQNASVAYSWSSTLAGKSNAGSAVGRISQTPKPHPKLLASGRIELESCSEKTAAPRPTVMHVFLACCSCLDGNAQTSHLASRTRPAVPFPMGLGAASTHEDGFPAERRPECVSVWCRWRSLILPVRCRSPNPRGRMPWVGARPFSIT